MSPSLLFENENVVYDSMLLVALSVKLMATSARRIVVRAGNSAVAAVSAGVKRARPNVSPQLSDDSSTHTSPASKRLRHRQDTGMKCEKVGSRPSRLVDRERRVVCRLVVFSCVCATPQWLWVSFLFLSSYFHFFSSSCIIVIT